MTSNYIKTIQERIYRLDALKLELKRQAVIREVTMNAINDQLDEAIEELAAAQWMEDNK